MKLTIKKQGFWNDDAKIRPMTARTIMFMTAIIGINIIQNYIARQIIMLVMNLIVFFLLVSVYSGYISYEADEWNRNKKMGNNKNSHGNNDEITYQN